MIELTLNIGCGEQGVGDVNCDLYGEEAHHGGFVIDPHIIRNFVVCDAQYLPFRANIFQTVFSSHVIEHVHNPFLMLKEMVRCSRKNVKVICPHKWFNLFQLHRGHHVSFLTKKWFISAAAKLNCFIQIQYSAVSFIFSIPIELTANLVKQDWEAVL